MMPAIITMVQMTLLALVIAVPLGLFTAIYLNEYAKRGNKLVNIIISTEDPVRHPSIVFLACSACCSLSPSCTGAHSR